MFTNLAIERGPHIVLTPLPPFIIPSFRRQLPRLGSWLIGRGGPRRQRQKLRQIRVGVPADDGHDAFALAKRDISWGYHGIFM